MKIAVIGNGVIGLTTAIKLLKLGRDVIIYSKDSKNRKTENTVSLVACALWQPYKLFTNLENYPPEKYELVKNVSLSSLLEFDTILTKEGAEKSGVYIKTHYEYSSESIYVDNTNIFKKDFYYIDILKDFWTEKGIKDAIIEEIKLKDKPPFQACDSEDNSIDFEYLHGYKTYVIDPSVFLKYLTQVFIELGGTLTERKLNLNEIKKLKEKVIFNCTGINGFSIINNKNINNRINRTLIPKKGVLLLYNLKDNQQFENTIVLDELTILCRQKQLTIGTGEIKQDENPEILINRLICHSKEFVNAPKIDKFGFDTFIKKQQIDLDNPSEKLIGGRPYFPDGKGYVLNNESHVIKSKKAFTIYNNFGHGGSGVTLSWGCANEITKLYQTNISEQLRNLNPDRNLNQVSDLSIEIAHFDIKKLHNLTTFEINELVKRENERFIEIKHKLQLSEKKISVSVLIDDKEAQNDKVTVNKLITALVDINVDFIAYESKLITYIDRLKKLLPPNITQEFNKYMYSHYKLGCAQDIFVWYCLRFGVINFKLDDEVIQPISEDAKQNKTYFYGNSLITLLDKGVRQFEDKADEYLTKSFGFEIPTAIRRFYY